MKTVGGIPGTAGPWGKPPYAAAGEFDNFCKFLSACKGVLCTNALVGNQTGFAPKTGLIKIGYIPREVFGAGWSAPWAHLPWERRGRGVERGKANGNS